MLSYLIGLSMGMCLLGLGLGIMISGLKKAAIHTPKAIMASFFGTPLRGVLSGMIVTMLSQSSSVISVALVGLADSDTLGVHQAIAVMAGANVGTTLTPQLIASGSVEASIFLSALGFILMILFKGNPPGRIGEALVGLSMLFLSMELMARTLEPLSRGPLQTFLQAFLTRPSASFLTGVVLTALLHSSSAAITLCMALAAAGGIALDSAIAFALGANVGTCATAVIASAYASASGKRVAMGHLVLNVVGTLVFLLLLSPFSALIRMTSPSLERQIANAHTIFNGISTLVTLPLLGQLVWLTTVLIPSRKERGHVSPKLSRQTRRVEENSLDH